MWFNSAKSKVILKKLVFIAVAIGLLFAVNNKFVKEKVFSVNKKISEEEVPTKIASINISIPEKDYDFLFSNLPISNRIFQKGKAIADEQPDIYNISFRLRGDHGWHWYKEKPSFRLRISGDRTLYSRKEIDYINPEDPSGFSNVMASIMATKAEIPHFLMTFSRVWINNDYKGLYIIADKKISSNLKNFDGITGPVVSGDNWDLKIWFDEKSWQYEQENTDIPLEKLESKMKELLEVLKPQNYKQIKNLLKNSLDIEKTLKWSAFMATIGSVHTDDFHNNCFVYDKTNEVYFPVIADPSGFGTLTSYLNKNEPSSIEQPFYEFLTPLFDTIFRSPELQYKRNLYVYDLINNKLTKEYLNKIVTNWRKLIEPLYDLEKNAMALIDSKMLLPMRLPVSAEYRKKDIDRLLEFYNLRVDFLMKQLNDCSLNVYTIKNDSSDVKQFVIGVNGNSPVKFDFSKINGKIFIDKDMNRSIGGDEVLKDSSLIFYPALKEETTNFSNIQTEWLQLKVRLKKYVLVPAEQTYLIGIDKNQEQQFLNILTQSGVNAITGKIVNTKVIDGFKLEDLYRPSHSFHCWSEYEKN